MWYPDEIANLEALSDLAGRWLARRTHRPAGPVPGGPALAGHPSVEPRVLTTAGPRR